MARFMKNKGTPTSTNLSFLIYFNFIKVRKIKRIHNQACGETGGFHQASKALDRMNLKHPGLTSIYCGTGMTTTLQVADFPVN